MYLYVHQPATLLATTVNGNVGYAQTIPTNAADTSAALRGMTLWVGTTAGGHDKGKIRIRANGVGANLYVSEHEIDLANGDYLTVKDVYELWHVSPFFTNAGVIYKDCDDVTAPTAIAYPGSNQAYQPVPVMGPHSIEFLGTAHDYDWTRSWAIAPGAAIAGYTATFPAGTPANSNAASGTVTWATQGARWVTLAVTDTNGITSYTGKRLYVTLDPDSLPDNCYVDFVPGPRMGQNGFTMQFTVYVDAPESDFPDGALVIWFFDGGTQEGVGGNWEYRTHIRFIGYVCKATTHKEPETGYVTFEASTINDLMVQSPVFPNFYEDEAAPAVWTEAASLTVQRAATLHMRWMSSLLEVADVLFVPSATTSIGEHEFPEGDLFSQLDGLVNRDYLYRIGCDYHGTVYINKDPQFLSDAARAGVATIMTLTNEDWYGEVDLPEPLQPQTGYVIASGNAYAGGTVTPLFSEAPGPVPLQFGQKDQSFSRLICTTQSALNILSGRALGAANVEYPDVPVKLVGQYYGLDHLFPMEFVGLTTTTKRAAPTGRSFVPRRSQLEVVYDEDGGVSHGVVSISLEELNMGGPGQTLTYPTEPSDPPDADEGPDGGDWVPDQPAGPSGTPGDGNLLYFVDGSNGHVYRTRNARDPVAANVVYEDLGQVQDLAIPATESQAYYITLDSWDPKNTAVVCGQDGIWKTTNLDDAVPTWTRVIDLSGSANWYGIMAASSICQQDFWIVGIQRHGGVDPEPWVYVTTDSFANITPHRLSLAALGPKVECSAHNAQVSWAIWWYGDGNTYVSKTVNQWGGWANTWMSCLGNHGGQVGANPYHRYSDNDSDLYALWGQGQGFTNRAVTAWCTNDVVCASCTIGYPGGAGATNERVRWLAGYTWGSNRYWCLTYDSADGKYRFYVSDDAITWTLQYTFVAASRYAYNWPYDDELFYACQSPGGVANRGPILISEDRGGTWQDQVGNWFALVGGWTGDIRCCVPVFTE